MKRALAILGLLGNFASFAMDDLRSETQREDDNMKQFHQSSTAFLWRMTLEGKNPSMPTRVQQQQRQKDRKNKEGDFADTDNECIGPNHR